MFGTKGALVTKLCRVAFLGPLVLAALAARADEAPPSPLEFPLLDEQLAAQARLRLQAYAATRALADAPEDPGTIAALTLVHRWDDAVRVLHAIVEKHPERMADALERLSHDWLSPTDAKTATQALAAELPAARQRLGELPREAAAHAAWALTLLELRVPPPKPWDNDKAIAEFVTEYRGTDIAEIFEIGRMPFSRDPRPKLDALDKLARQHPGTVLAAQALHTKGFNLAQQSSMSEPRGADPTARFLQVIDVVAELESGRYPPCEWVRKAPQLVADYHAFEPTYAPGNAEKMLAAYERFVTSHLGADADDAMRGRIEWILGGHMAPLYKIAGRDGGLDAFLDKLRRAPNGPGADYIDYVQAQLALRAAFPTGPPERQTLFAKARTLFAALADRPAGTYPRRALATLADIDFFDADCARAVPSMKRYVELYPRGGWAWIAALRLGLCLEKGGDSEQAIQSYLDAATTYGADAPAPRVLGHALAAEAAARLGYAKQALAEYRLALAS